MLFDVSNLKRFREHNKNMQNKTSNVNSVSYWTAGAPDKQHLRGHFKLSQQYCEIWQPMNNET